MADPSTSRDQSDHLDRLVQLARRAVREARRRSHELNVANVYSIDGRLYYEHPNGEWTRDDAPPTD